MAEKLNAEALAKIGKVAEIFWEDSRGKHGWTGEIEELPYPTIRRLCCQG